MIAEEEASKKKTKKTTTKALRRIRRVQRGSAMGGATDATRRALRGKALWMMLLLL